MEPLKNMRSDTIAKFFVNKIIARYGAVDKVLTDMGRSFTSEFIEEVFKLTSSAHITTVPYNPKCNGLTERAVRTVRSLMSHYVNEKHNDWDLNLQFLAFAYNSTKQSTTLESPYFMLFNREPRLPLDVSFKLTPDFKFGQKFKNALEESKKLVRIRVEEAQEVQKRTYDSRHFQATFNVGSLVGLHVHKRQVGLTEKMLPAFEGPYRITRKLGKVTYEIENVNNPRKRHKKVNLQLLKKWNSEPIEGIDNVYETPMEPIEKSASKRDYSDTKDRAESKEHRSHDPSSSKEQSKLGKQM
jgi:hypothetical protein